jgi:hypothetical protein
MNEKLTYEEWRAKYMVTVTDDVVSELNNHNIDALKEIETAMRKEYEFYLNGGFNELPSQSA